MSPIGSAKTSLGGGLRALGLCGDGARGHHEPAGEHGRHGAAQQRAGRMVRSHVGLLLSVPSAAPLGRLPMPLSGPRQGAQGVAELSANRGGVYTRRALPGKEVQVNVRKSDLD